MEDMILGLVKINGKYVREISQDRPKKVFVTNIDLKNKNDQNRLKCFIKISKYTLIPLGLINLDIRIYS